MKKQHEADGKGINDHNGTNAKQEKLGGSPLANILRSEHTDATDTEVNGDPFVELVVKPSTQKGIDDSEGMNRTCLLLALAGISEQKYDDTTGTEEVKRMKNATTKLKLLLGTLQNMAPHPRNRNGSNLKNDKHGDDPLPYYNMPMIFYFKGRVKDVAQYQQKVEKPSKKEVAMLVKKRDEKLAQMK